MKRSVKVDSSGVYILNKEFHLNCVRCLNVAVPSSTIRWHYTNNPGGAFEFLFRHLSDALIQSDSQLRYKVSKVKEKKVKCSLFSLLL